MLFLALVISVVTSHKIAIVGGGIGGTSNAFFIRQLLGDEAEIKVRTFYLSFSDTISNVYISALIKS